MKIKKIFLIGLVMLLGGCFSKTEEEKVIDYMANEMCIEKHWSTIPLIHGCDGKQRRINSGFRWQQDLVDALENIEEKGDEYFEKNIKIPAEKQVEENCLRWIEWYSEDLLKRADEISC